MASSSLLVPVVLGVLFCTPMLQYSNGQFPIECMNDTSLQDRQCCPNMCSGRGSCTNLNLASLSDVSFDNLTVRDNWPYYFMSVCKCNGNYAGADCSRCKYGYYGDDCSKTMTLPRRPISDLTDDEWTEYIDILKMMRTYSSGYFVFTEEPKGPDTDLRTLEKTPVNLYDLFIWQHHYAAKDNENKISFADYAHESTGFPTWHRQYLLWVEWEIQYMLKETRPLTYHKFRLYYWDWRKDMQTNENSPLKRNRLGETVDINGFPRVQGDLVSNGWDTKCWNLENGSICDPNTATGPLQRCPFTGTDPCNINNPDWPTSADVSKAIGMSRYDDDTYNNSAKSGFRNFMEGFNVLNNGQGGLDTCSSDRLCLCGGDRVCDGPNPGTPIARLLHNSVHIILGIAHFDNTLERDEKGVMADVAAASSDPIFINHHAMIDCILEEWFQKNKNAQYPRNAAIQQGHRYNDYIVPFFPLVTQGEMFKTADNFGYSCKLSGATRLGSAPLFELLALTMFFILMIL